MLNRFRKIWRPAMYQGKSNMKQYFEGWYFKIVDKSEKNIFAIIPGVSFNKDHETSHSFIQFFNGVDTTSYYFEYPLSNFWFSKRKFEIKIGNNYFSLDRINLDITKNRANIHGELRFNDQIPWPVTLTSPGVMGWYTFVPFMECYHDILSFDHSIEGKLKSNGKEIDFTNGRAYVEKDRGRSFPSYWIWMQTNHFKKEGISLMISIANIPWLGRSFDGFLGGLLYNNTLYRFTTYTGAKITKLQLPENKVIVHLASKKYRLEVEAAKSKGAELKTPVLGAMEGRLLESITSEIHVKLYKTEKKKELIFDGTGRNAGLEIGGEIEKLKLLQ